MNLIHNLLSIFRPSTVMPEKRLPELPKDIILEIFTYFDVHTLARFASLNHSFKELAFKNITYRNFREAYLLKLCVLKAQSQILLQNSKICSKIRPNSLSSDLIISDQTRPIQNPDPSPKYSTTQETAINTLEMKQNDRLILVRKGTVLLGYSTDEMEDKVQKENEYTYTVSQSGIINLWKEGIKAPIRHFKVLSINDPDFQLIEAINEVYEFGQNLLLRCSVCINNIWSSKLIRFDLNDVLNESNPELFVKKHKEWGYVYERYNVPFHWKNNLVLWTRTEGIKAYQYDSKSQSMNHKWNCILSDNPEEYGLCSIRDYRINDNYFLIILEDKVKRNILDFPLKYLFMIDLNTGIIVHKIEVETHPYYGLINSVVVYQVFLTKLDRGSLRFFDALSKKSYDGTLSISKYSLKFFEKVRAITTECTKDFIKLEIHYQGFRPSSNIEDWDQGYTKTFKLYTRNLREAREKSPCLIQ